MTTTTTSSEMPGETPGEMPDATPSATPGEMASETPSVRLVSDLVARIPEFRDVYEDHVFRQGVVQPHVFFWDVVQDTVRSFLGEAPATAADWRRTLAFLEEQSCRGILGIDEVIVTSFLGDLPSPHEPGHAIVQQLGPVMAAKFVRIRPLG
ncbi:hypothetical protein [Streptomyces exfoliatus]|uniref:hypothetical protein n=1 Tax=Streptomyces exfoliatus TaxID=1905 RepID=UPI0004C9E61B|nr:hypothetical protein [Streptomyces exfoliatus]